MTQIPTIGAGISGGDGARSISPLGTEPIALSALRARQIRLEWFEAIAIVQALRTSTEKDGIDLADRSLAPGDVVVHADGQVTAIRKSSRNTADSHAVHGAARLLGDLLPQTFPTPLRLALTQAMSSPPFYPSLADFSDALAYFERPNRSGVVQAVYQRWKDSKGQLAAPAASTQQHSSPPRIQKARRPLPVRRLVHLGVIVVASVSVSAVIVWQFRNGENGSGLAAHILQPTTAAVDSVLDRLLPLQAETPAESQSPAIPVAAASRRSEPVARRMKQSVTADETSSAATQQIAAFDLRVPMGGLPESLIAEERQTRTVVVVAGPYPNTGIYSEEDSEVLPPVATYPRLPSSLPLGTLAEDLAVIDLVINESGSVETVKLRNDPATMADAMMLTMSLSAAKTWRFDPAMKDGYPVRYRKSIWVLTH